MLLFIIKKEVLDWIRTGQKNIELRRGKAKRGDVAVFPCGRNILRGKVVKREEGNFLSTTIFTSVAVYNRKIHTLCRFGVTRHDKKLKMSNLGIGEMDPRGQYYSRTLIQ